MPRDPVENKWRLAQVMASVMSDTWTFTMFHNTIKYQQGPKRKMGILLMITHRWFNENIYNYFTNSVISLLHLPTNFLTHTIVNFSTIFPVSNIWKTQSSWQHMDSKIVNSIHNKSFILSVMWRRQFSQEETTKCCTTRANYEDDDTHQCVSKEVLSVLHIETS